MGARGSTLAAPDGRCEWCGNVAADAKVHSEYSTCQRCSGIVSRRKSSSRRSPSFSSSRSQDKQADDEKGEGMQLPLSLLHILPFAETLPASETAPTEALLLSRYLLPFFSTRRGLYISAGMRFQIQEVDFKVTACFPPAGLLSERTRIRSMHAPLHALTELQKLHVLPTAASLPSPLSPQSIFHEYLKPFFIPQQSSSSSKAEAAAAAASSSSSQSSSSASAAPTVAVQHHLAEGDTFMSRGVQFKVVACEPPDGIVTTSCDIFPEGAALPDVRKIRILPVYESLPNNEKAITGEQVMERYLQPYFSGRFQLVSLHDMLEIDGVTFRVTACEPEKGLVTMQSSIYTEGEPLRADDIRRQQELEDEQLARRMQQQEARDNGYIMRPAMGDIGYQPPYAQSPLSMANGGLGPGLGGFAPMPGGGLVFRRPAAISSPDELRLRLQELLRQMPEHDLHRINAVRRLIETLPRDNGATRRDIEALPTRLYQGRPQTAAATTAVSASSSATAETQTADHVDEKAERKEAGSSGAASSTSSLSAAAAGSKEENREHLMCMVCLCDYEEGDLLRTLPCFHSYHQLCIDEWLGRNKACPLCKNPIC